MRSTANGRSNLENNEDSEEDVFGGVEGIYAANEEQEAAGSEQESTAVPADIVERMELVGYLGDGCGYDCAVLELLVQ